MVYVVCVCVFVFSGGICDVCVFCWLKPTNRKGCVVCEAKRKEYYRLFSREANTGRVVCLQVVSFVRLGGLYVPKTASLKHYQSVTLHV